MPLKNRTIDVDPVKWEKLNDIAKRKGVSRALLVRLLIDYYIENEPKLKMEV